MKLEHAAYPVRDPVAVAAWYVAHCGLRIIRQTGPPTMTHFLSDGAGGVIEIYNNQKVTVPDYTAIDPLLLHIAFVATDLPVERDRLLAAGCTEAEPITTTPAGDVLVMLRDPWGFALQLTHRRQAMV